MNIEHKSPPPLPKSKASRERRRDLIIIFAVLVPWILLLMFIKFRVPPFFYVVSDAMAPEIVKGDHAVLCKFRMLKYQPHRGDIIAFKWREAKPKSPKRFFFVERVVGEPGDRLRLCNGDLYLNDQKTKYANSHGLIVYSTLSGSKYLKDCDDVVQVLPNDYFVLGDNSGHSYDSRGWGFLEAGEIVGKVGFCYSRSEGFRAVK